MMWFSIGTQSVFKQQTLNLMLLEVVVSYPIIIIRILLLKSARR